MPQALSPHTQVQALGNHSLALWSWEMRDSRGSQSRAFYSNAQAGGQRVRVSSGSSGREDVQLCV